MFNTNAVGPHLGVQTSMLNHSCVPNAYAAFDDGIKRLTVRALRDIEEGEEVCIAYLDAATLLEPAFSQPSSSLVTRRMVLQLQRGFECLCDSCVALTTYVADGGRLEEHPGEVQRAELRSLIEEYRWRESIFEKDRGHSNTRGLYLDYAKYLTSLVTGIVDRLESLGLATVDNLEWYQLAIKWHDSLKDEEGARKWHEKLLSVVRLCVGRNSQMYWDISRSVDRSKFDLANKHARVNHNHERDSNNQARSETIISQK